MIKLALPNKGQLFEPTLEMLAACDYKVSKNTRALSVVDTENGVEFYFLRPWDIPLYVANGVLDAGITGKDFVAERRQDVDSLCELNYGHSKMCAAVPVESSFQQLSDIAHCRIATAFPHITEDYFNNSKLNLVELEGAVEISVKLGIADAIVDIVETGSTLKAAGLRILGEPLFYSQAFLLAHPGKARPEELVILKARMEGHRVAKEYLMIEYDVPKENLDKACLLTPGIESPTVSTLHKEGWLAVKALVLKRGANRILDELSKIGCKGILLTRVESARI